MEVARFMKITIRKTSKDDGYGIYSVTCDNGKTAYFSDRTSTVEHVDFLLSSGACQIPGEHCKDDVSSRCGSCEYFQEYLNTQETQNDRD